MSDSERLVELDGVLGGVAVGAVHLDRLVGESNALSVACHLASDVSFVLRSPVFFFHAAFIASSFNLS